MSERYRLLSILHIAYGSMHLLFGMFFVSLGAVFSPFLIDALRQDDRFGAVGESNIQIALRVVQLLAFLFLILISLPSLIGGIAGLKNKPWALSTMLVSGCLALLNFPLGTGLGIFTIVIQSDTKKERTDPPLIA